MIAQWITLALATFISEDLTCIAAGALIAGRMLGVTEGMLACLAGIFAGDLLLFFTGRWCGAAALRWPPLARLLPPNRVAQAKEWVARRGLAVVLLSRFTPGLRLPTYVAAGIVRTPAWRFAGHLLIAASVWTPLLVGATALLGETAARWLVTRAWLISIVAFAAAFVLLKIARRIPRWEFWPIWAAYLPLAPYFVWLAIRHRSATLFTAANPGIPSSGLMGESKSEILAALPEHRVAAFHLIRSSFSPAARIATATRFMREASLTFPVVLKPDAGERGAGVAVARSPEELANYLCATRVDTIVQRYVPGQEFGLYYAQGRLVSITDKRLPEVIGDGNRSIEELILADSRASRIIDVYRRNSTRPLSDVPYRTERVRLIDVGTHSRGAIFLDGRRLWTPALQAAVDRVSRAFPGFLLGRYDVRTESDDALRRGEFVVLELNGVAAEPTHIYDPSVTVIEAYRALALHWRMAFELGARHRARGVRPMRLRELIAMLRKQRQQRPARSARYPTQVRLSS